MKSLADLYELINTGTNTPNTDFTTPTTIVATMNSLGDTYDLLKTKITAIDVTKILTGTTILGKAGTMSDNGAVTITPGTGNQTIVQGYHNGSGTVEGDADLIASNIKSGANIFGIPGSLLTTPTYGDNNASKVLNTASNPGSYDPNTCSTTYNTLNLSAGTVKNGTTFGDSQTGDYPSVTYTLPGDTGTTDATNSSVLSGFEAWSKAGALLTGSAILALGDAVAGNVLFGKSFSNATISNVLGTMPDKTGLNVASSAQSQAGGVNYFTATQGYYDGIAKVSATDAQVAALDADIAVGNIKSGTTIFGVAGNLTSLDTSDATATTADIISPKTAYVNGVKITGTAFPGGLLKTGQTTVHQEGDDGTYQKGFSGTRFADNGNGTITDNATGLMWIKDHNAVGAPFNAQMTWTNAITNCEALSYAGQTDWRLPNLRELQSIVDYSRLNPAVDPLFTNTQSSFYWSSTTKVGITSDAWYVYFPYGTVGNNPKTSNSYYVRCTR